jgi:hypothetical protein
MGGYILYAMPASLYSAKARSYLRKRGIDHLERANGHPAYRERIVPALGPVAAFGLHELEAGVRAAGIDRVR